MPERRIYVPPEAPRYIPPEAPKLIPRRERRIERDVYVPTDAPTYVPQEAPRFGDPKPDLNLPADVTGAPPILDLPEPEPPVLDLPDYAKPEQAGGSIEENDDDEE